MIRGVAVSGARQEWPGQNRMQVNTGYRMLRRARFPSSNAVRLYRQTIRQPRHFWLRVCPCQCTDSTCPPFTFTNFPYTVRKQGGIFHHTVRKQEEIFHPAGGIFETLSSKDLFRSQEWQAKFILLKVCGYHPPFPIADRQALCLRGFKDQWQFLYCSL